MKYTYNDDIANNQQTIAIKLLCLFTQQSLQATHIEFYFLINTRLHKPKMCLVLTKKSAQYVVSVWPCCSASGHKPQRL